MSYPVGTRLKFKTYSREWGALYGSKGDIIEVVEPPDYTNGRIPEGMFYFKFIKRPSKRWANQMTPNGFDHRNPEIPQQIYGRLNEVEPLIIDYKADQMADEAEDLL